MRAPRFCLNDRRPSVRTPPTVRTIKGRNCQNAKRARLVIGELRPALVWALHSMDLMHASARTRLKPGQLRPVIDVRARPVGRSARRYSNRLPLRPRLEASRPSAAHGLHALLCMHVRLVPAQDLGASVRTLGARLRFGHQRRAFVRTPAWRPHGLACSATARSGRPPAPEPRSEPPTTSETSMPPAGWQGRKASTPT